MAHRVLNRLPSVTMVILAIVFLACSNFNAQSSEVVHRDDLAAIFDRHNAVGTFVVHSFAIDRLIVVNPERAHLPQIPASTFKIANSIIALETGVVSDVDEIIPYGGKPQRLKKWEQDMSMRHAIRASSVPVYQELARRIGLKRYGNWLEKLNYGNGETGHDLEHFWLKGPLKISAVEQVEFLNALANQNLDVSKQTINSVKQITALQRSGTRSLHGKTGWSVQTWPQIGWFVGWVESEDGSHAFALNMDMNDKADRHKRRMIAMDILKSLEIY